MVLDTMVKTKVIENAVWLACPTFWYWRRGRLIVHKRAAEKPFAMSAHFPDAEKVRAVLALATRAPSIDNTQPWRWRVGRTSLHLYADSGMQLPNTDPDGRDLMFSCGATLNHCIIALAATGWHAEVCRLPDPADPSHLAAIEVWPRTPDREDITLAAAIEPRRTDRRICRARPVPASDIAVMDAPAVRMGVMLRQVDAMDKLNKIARRAARDHATNRDYLVELAMWSGRYGSRASEPARNTPERRCSAPIPWSHLRGPLAWHGPRALRPRR